MAETNPAPSPSRSDDLDRARRYQRVLLALGRHLGADREFEDFLRHAVEEVARATRIGRAKVARYRPRQGDLLIVAGVGWKEGVVGHATMSIDVASSAGRTVRSGQITEVPDFHEETEFRPARLHEEHGIVSLLNVPIFVEGAVWGILELDHDKPRRYTPETIALLQGGAQLIGFAAQRERERRAFRTAREANAREADRRQILLREMQHRVKNNFQLITSMILIMQRGAAGPTRSALATLADRLMAMALAHEQLDPDQSVEVVEIDVYLGALCRSLAHLSSQVGIDASVDRVSVPVETAVAIGLIVNELAINALKHAFDGPGNIWVELRTRWDSNLARLTVTDDGKGFDAGNWESSTGTALIESLAAQLEGTVERESPGQGTVVRVTFRLQMAAGPNAL